MDILCQQLADLEELSKLNTQLEQQLAQEKIRADKAEKHLADFGQMVFELQNRVSTTV